jgi:hypothetical protein
MELVQQSLFPLDDSDRRFASDARPLPLIVADKWGFKLAYVDQDGSADNYLYAGQDWYKGLGGGRQGWSKLKNQLSISSRQLPYEAADGKTYEIDFLTAADLYMVAMEMRPLKRRPQLDEIREYLRDAGVFADKVRRDPKWAAARIEGKIARSAFMEALAAHVVNMSQQGYGVATNDVYRGLFHRDASQLKADLKTDKPREKMSQPALHYLGIAEWACAQHIGEAQELTFVEARAIIQDVAGLVGLQVDELERRFQIDIVTGRKLLSAVDAIRGA